MSNLPVTFQPFECVLNFMSDEKEQHAVTASSHIPCEYLATVKSDATIPLESSVTNIVMSDFARDWFEDARNEATRETDNDIAAAAARRREIIFAVCALESYLFEWVRGILLPKESAMLLCCSSIIAALSDRRESITDKWKDIPKMLCDDGLIKETPDLGCGSTWKEFKKIYNYRNNLIHAGVSRPKKEVSPYLDPPAASVGWKAELSRLRAGWAVEIVAELIKDLNDKAGRHAPSWLNP